jgi:hypothetical protein
MKKFLSSLILAASLFVGSQAFAAMSATLTWQDNSSNEDQFIVEKSDLPAGTFTQIGLVGTNVTTFTETNLLPGTQYCYRVKASNAAGVSLPSNVACVTTLSIPTAPGNITVIITTTP